MAAKESTVDYCRPNETTFSGPWRNPSAIAIKMRDAVSGAFVSISRCIKFQSNLFSIFGRNVARTDRKTDNLISPITRGDTNYRLSILFDLARCWKEVVRARLFIARSPPWCIFFELRVNVPK